MLKDKEGGGKMQMKNRTEIRNAKTANTVQASVHKEADSCWGGNTDVASTDPGSGSQRRKLEERRVSFSSICKDAREVNRRRGRAKEELARGVEGGGVTNLDCENLITVETCVRAVVRWTLRRGSDTLKGESKNCSSVQMFCEEQHNVICTW